MKTAFDFSVTFEYETLPPQTLKGVVHGSHVSTCASRAVREAQKGLQAKGWSSVVCLLSRAGLAPNV